MGGGATDRTGPGSGGGGNCDTIPPGINTGGGLAVENRGMPAMAAGGGMLPMLVCIVPVIGRVAAAGAGPVVVPTAGAEAASPGIPGWGHLIAAGVVGMGPPVGRAAGGIARWPVGSAAGTALG